MMTKKTPRDNQFWYVPGYVDPIDADDDMGFDADPDDAPEERADITDSL